VGKPLGIHVDASPVLFANITSSRYDLETTTLYTLRMMHEGQMCVDSQEVMICSNMHQLLPHSIMSKKLQCVTSKARRLAKGVGWQKQHSVF
jgi:hypothetical protein